MMILNQWKEHECDGHVYKLVITHEYQHQQGDRPYRPQLLALLCNAEYEAASKALKPHPLDRLIVNEEYNVEVEGSAFNDFDHLCGFAKEIGALLECDPATIIKAI